MGSAANTRSAGAEQSVKGRLGKVKEGTRQDLKLPKRPK